MDSRRCGREGDMYVPTAVDMRESTLEEAEGVHVAGTSGCGELSTQRGGKEHVVEEEEDENEADD